LEVVDVKKLFGLLAFFLQYLAFLEAVRTCYQTSWCLGFLTKILLKSVIIRLF